MRRGAIRSVVGSLALACAVMACAASPRAQESPPLSEDQRHAVATPPDSAATYHFMLGYQAELAHDIETALREYHATVEADPAARDAKARLAALYFGLGDLSNAAHYAEQAGEGDGQSAQLLTQMAGILAGAGKPERAVELLDKAIGHAPERAESYFSKGLILLNLKRTAEAEQAVKQGLIHAPESHVGHYYLGRISTEAGNIEQAIAGFTQALTVNPSFEPPYLALASIYETRKERDKAVGLLQQYLQQVNPHNKEVRRHLVQLHITGKDYAAALAELERILAEDPSDLDAQLRMALIHGEQKEYAKAITRVTAILQARPDELRVRDYLGYLYEETKDYPKAIDSYRYNLQLDPRFVESHVHLGVLQYRLKHFPEAITYLSEAVRLNPKQPEPHIVLGLAYLQSDQFQKAVEAFEEGIAHHPRNADLHFNLGTAYDKLDRFDDVVRAMETALALDPHHADALNYLGYSYAERGIKLDQALALTKRAVALKPDNGYYVDSLGWALYKSGMVGEALQEIQRAITLVKDDPVIYEHLGEIYLHQHKRAEAREAWLHSLELDPSNGKLLERFREQGFGDPDQELRIQQAKQRIAKKKTIAPSE
ncbi:MAG: tetratricopeptide repeat protein [Nitrospira sp.]|nr:tetratricopeptide repeat protein [Nitrospira sp.]MCP9440971.1 tetratricopeptide repeat protein [Nitrospira sp.]